jgi:Ras-related protein Rab-2A
LNRKETFEHIGTWLDDVRLNSDVDTVITLVGNKGDLENKRQVSREEAQNYAEQNGLLFHEVSAKTAYKVTETFFRSAKMAYDRYKSGEFQIDGASPNTTQLGPVSRIFND